MNGRGLDERDLEDIGSRDDYRLAQRVLAALQHPDSPMPMFDFEAKKLSRHIAIRINRTKLYDRNAKNAAAKALRG